MKLLLAGPSPFVRKVRVLLHETDQLDDVEMVHVTASPLGPDPELVAVNPTGKIPALIRKDGPAIYDSRVICRFLDDRARSNLYPASRLWETLTLEATADAMMDAAVLMVYEARFKDPAQQSHDWIEGQWAKVDRALDAIETRWMSHLSGRMDMAHIAMACALSYLDFRHEGRNWRKGHDALAKWHATFAARESMIATQPE